MADSKEKLFSEFPPVSTQTWMDRVVADLKGADFEKRLVWKTNEGFKVKPFYRAEDLEGLQTTESLPGIFPYVRGTKTNNQWFVRQDIQVNDPASANKKALDILNKGVNSLGFIVNKSFTANDLDVLLKDICLDCVEINFRSCSKKTLEIAQSFASYAEKNNYNLSAIKGSVNYDPFKRMLTKGKHCDCSLSNEIQALLDATQSLPNFKVIGVNAYLFNKAGAYCAQELGLGLSYGNAFLDIAQDAGMDIAAVASKIKFNFGVGSNYFMEIAKFRAARMLWALIVEAYAAELKQSDAAKINIHAATSEWNQSVYDANVNMLRSQTETMSAAIAGVDSITVTPFDASFKQADDFSERIARNQQLLLKEESHFDQIVDASAGSYYIENLTSALSKEAWNLFLETEDLGGFVQAVKKGEVQKRINETGEKRLSDISARKEVLLGTNQFPNFNETALNKIKEADNQPAKPCCCSGKEGGNDIPVLIFRNGSAQFDALRLATEKSGKRPKVFMLTIGSLNMRLARAQFACNFFACAGYEVVDNLGFETAGEGVAAARAAGADIIVICSSDEEYATLAPEAFKAIGQGKELFVVAGAPECTEDLKAIGINLFINVRSNVLQTLQSFSKQLGIL